jgi:hypothetical protein
MPKRSKERKARYSEINVKLIKFEYLNPTTLTDVDWSAVIANVVIELHNPHEGIPGGRQRRVTERSSKILQHNVEDKL